ncbi:MAG: Asp23/Gls24 family envelope stress response protein [Anaerolineales bacterium]|nr:Asp23/Gls24 family envelope stress response protein [Anaerolineales bacterium]
MSSSLRSPGLTTVAPDVLLAIARLTALQVDGVYAMARAPRRSKDEHTTEGVLASIFSDEIDLDLYLVLHKDVNLRQVARAVQDEVHRAITEMVGMSPGHINVHIEDIHYPEA